MKFNKFSVLFSFIVTFIQFSHPLNIVPLSKCFLTDSSCWKAQAQSTLQTFAQSIPELVIKNIHELLLDDIIAEDLNGFYYNWTNIKVEGLQDAVVKKINLDLDLKTLQLSLETTVTIKVNYGTKGTFLSVAPIYGHGKGEITIKRLQLDMLAAFNILKEDNGMDVIDINNYYYGFNAADGVSFDFDNLYDGDVKKSESFLKFCNDNWRIAMDSYGGFVKAKITDKLFDIIKKFMRVNPLTGITNVLQYIN